MATHKSLGKIHPGDKMSCSQAEGLTLYIYMGQAGTGTGALVRQELWLGQGVVCGQSRGFTHLLPLLQLSLWQETLSVLKVAPCLASSTQGKWNEGTCASCWGKGRPLAAPSEGKVR